VKSIIVTVLMLLFSAFLSSPDEKTINHCALRDTEIRQNPTGYILSRIEKGTPVKFVDSITPFAWIEHNGILGTVTESHIGECE
jgi:hypothetical protein